MCKKKLAPPPQKKNHTTPTDRISPHYEPAVLVAYSSCIQTVHHCARVLEKLLIIKMDCFNFLYRAIFCPWTLWNTETEYLV